MKKLMKTYTSAVLAALAAVALAAAAAVSSASAGTTTAPGLTCSDQIYSQPFLPWLDPANYVLMQNGDLESTSGWELTNGAKLVSGNEPFTVHDPQDRYSLSLPSGSSATTPPLCITLLHPDLRFFAVNTGAQTSTLKVEAITTVDGIQTATPIGLLSAGGSWQPTLPLPFLTNLASPVSGTVSFRFTPVGQLSGWQIDDIYVDPYKSG
jgi:hypothetical protein